MGVILLSGCATTNEFLEKDGNEGNRDTLPVKLETLIEMAEHCKEVYEEGEELEDDQFSYNLVRSGGISILIFRGTANAKNVLTDIDIRFIKDDDLDLYLHKGFMDAATTVMQDIDNNHTLDKTVYLTGHSLGGAMAQIVGMWLDKRGKNVQIFTFGSPKVTTTFLYNEPNHWRVAMRSDPVPFLPPYPYVHSGIHIDPETLDWDESHEEGNIMETDGLDHSINEYLDILNERTPTRID